MLDFDYPTATSADICLLLEGTYPLVSSGVANWAHELIRVFPTYRFAVIFLGTRAEDYTKPCYPLPPNLVHLEMHFLFESNPSLSDIKPNIKPQTMQRVRCMHERFKGFLTEKQSIPEVFELLNDNTILNQDVFSRSKQVWEYLIEQYDSRHADQSFFDYFWSVRNLHHPFWKLTDIVAKAPQCKILHSASTGYAGFLGALIQKKQSVPYVLTEHGIYTKERWIDIMRHYFFEHVIHEQGAKDSQTFLLEIWMRFFTILGKIAYDAANPIISLFEGARERQIEDGALPERTKIIPYGIDCKHYHFLGKDKPNREQPILACIGRIVSIKDIKTFIQTCAIIKQTIPLVQGWIVGSLEEDKEYVATCENLVEILGLASNIQFLGPQNVMDIYPKLDLLVLTSISEGSPFVILESLAVGIPVVVTDVGACSELILGKSTQDKALGPAGRLVNIADPKATAANALALLTHDAEWKKAQLAGTQRINTFYNMDLLIKNYGDIYQQWS